MKTCGRRVTLLRLPPYLLHHPWTPPARPAPHLDVLAILLLRLVLALLIEQSLLLALDEGLKVSPVAIQPLAVQVDDVCSDGIQEVPVVRDD